MSLEGNKHIYSLNKFLTIEDVYDGFYPTCGIDPLKKADK